MSAVRRVSIVTTPANAEEALIALEERIAFLQREVQTIRENAAKAAATHKKQKTRNGRRIANLRLQITALLEYVPADVRERTELEVKRIVQDDSENPSNK